MNHTFSRNEQGGAIVEFALVLPLLVGLFLGTWQFGYAYYLYGELEQAVRDGGRFASLTSYDAANPNLYQDAIKNVVVYGDPAGGTKPFVPGLLPSNVSVTLAYSGHYLSTVTIAISNYQLPAMFSKVMLINKPGNTFPYLGDWAPL